MYVLCMYGEVLCTRIFWRTVSTGNTHTHTHYKYDGDFPGCPVVKTLSYNAGSVSLISGRGAEIPHASWPEHQNIKQKQYCNKSNKDFENAPHQKKKKKP